MEQQILETLRAQADRLDEIQQSVEKVRKYFMWSLIAMLLTIVLPLIGLVVIIPIFLQQFSKSLEGTLF